MTVATPGTPQPTGCGSWFQKYPPGVRLRVAPGEPECDQRQGLQAKVVLEGGGAGLGFGAPPTSSSCLSISPLGGSQTFRAPQLAHTHLQEHLDLKDVLRAEDWSI